VSIHTLANELDTLALSLADAPPRMVLPAPASPEVRHDHAARHHFASIGVRFPDVVSRQSLEDLTQAYARNLQRAKGVVTLREAPGEQFVWSYLGGDRRVRFDRLPETGFAPVAVFVGAGLPANEIIASVHALQDR
jgi:G3E family GTPase